MKADYIKKRLRRYMMWQLQHIIAVVEYGGAGTIGVADTFGITSRLYTYEFEIKVAKTDLIGELNSIDIILNNSESSLFSEGTYKRSLCAKLDKHSRYLQTAPPGDGMPWGNSEPDNTNVPNYFAFAVPKDLTELALEKLQGSPYGLFEVNNWPNCIKRPTALHKEKVSTKEVLKLATRCVGEHLEIENTLESYKEEHGI